MDIIVRPTVPQGSHLGPILSLLYIKGTPLVIKHFCIPMYVDDVKLFHYSHDMKGFCRLQFDLLSLVRLREINGVALNLRKCKAMSFINIHTTFNLEMQSVITSVRSAQLHE